MTPAAVYVMVAALSGSEPAPALTRVDAISHRVAALIEDGCRRSTTFRTLVTQIEGTPWHVFIQDGACPGTETIGCLLHTVGHYHGEPYLRIRVAVRGRNPQQIISTLAHELQHAWEVISDPSVVDSDTLSAMFRRIGFETLHTSSAQIFETAEADRVGFVVLHELDLEK